MVRFINTSTCISIVNVPTVDDIDGAIRLKPLESVTRRVKFEPVEEADHEIFIAFQSTWGRIFEIRCCGVGVHPLAAFEYSEIVFSPCAFGDERQTRVRLLQDRRAGAGTDRGLGGSNSKLIKSGHRGKLQQFAHDLRRVGTHYHAQPPTSLHQEHQHQHQYRNRHTIDSMVSRGSFSATAAVDDDDEVLFQFSTPIVVAVSSLAPADGDAIAADSAKLAVEDTIPKSVSGQHRSRKTASSSVEHLTSGGLNASPNARLMQMTPDLQPPTTASITSGGGSGAIAVGGAAAGGGASGVAGKNAHTPMRGLLNRAVVVPLFLPDLVLVEPDGGRCDMDKIPLGERAYHEICIKNTSSVPITLKSSGLSPHGPFRLVNALRKLGPHETRQIRLAFEPELESKFSSILEIASAKSRISIRVSGEGVVPTLQIDPADRMLIMGDVCVGDQVSKTFKLTNTAAIPIRCVLSLSSTLRNSRSNVLAVAHPTYGTLNSTGMSAFTLFPMRCTIQPGASHDITVKFTPDSESDLYYEQISIKYYGQPSPLIFKLYGRAWEVTTAILGYDLQPDAARNTVWNHLANKLDLAATYHKIEGASAPLFKGVYNFVEEVAKLGEEQMSELVRINARRDIQFVTVSVPWKQVAVDPLTSATTSTATSETLSWRIEPREIILANLKPSVAKIDIGKKSPVAEFTVEKFAGSFEFDAELNEFVVVHPQESRERARSEDAKAESIVLGLEPSKGTIDWGQTKSLKVVVGDPVREFSAAFIKAWERCSETAVESSGAVKEKPGKHHAPTAATVTTTAATATATQSSGTDEKGSESRRVAQLRYFAKHPEKISDPTQIVSLVSDNEMTTYRRGYDLFDAVKPHRIESVFKITIKGGCRLVEPKGVLYPGECRAWLVKIIGLSVFVAYRWTKLRQRGRPSDDSASVAAWERLHSAQAPRVYRAIVGLQGLWIKLGQYLSTRGDILPAAYVELFAQLQDSVPPKPWEPTRQTICNELGISSLDEIFESFDETPLATASIAQVHRAWLRYEYARRTPGYDTGEFNSRSSSGAIPVVVKVQHPNIAARILHDLLDLRLIIRIIGYFEPEFDFTPIVSEWSSEVPKELDFVNEAQNTVYVRDSIKAHNEDGGFHSTHPLYVDCGFADPIESLVTKRVLVMKYIDGFKILDRKALEDNQVPVDDVVFHIIKAYAFQIYTLGFWNSDPHPGNFLVARINGVWKPVLLDFGLTKRATATEVTALARILLSSKNMDFTGLLSGLQQIGMPLAVDRPERAMEAIQFLFRDTTTMADAKRESQLRIEKEQKEQQKRIKANAPAPKRLIDAFPGVLIFFGRVITLLRGLCMNSDSRQSYLQIMTPFAEFYLLRTVRSPEKRVGHLPLLSLPPDSLDFLIRSKMYDLIDRFEMLGAQVVVYHHGEQIACVSGGVCGFYDPRPVQNSTLFPVFSCTKAITAAALHMLVDRGLASYNDTVVKHWPEFSTSSIANWMDRTRKSTVRIAHLLSHTSGLQLAGSDILNKNPMKMTDWDAMVHEMETAVPDSYPGNVVAYHIVSFGWLVGELVARIAKKPFKVVVSEMLVQMGLDPFDGYIGIPTGVEDRLASVYWDSSELGLHLDVDELGPDSIATLVQPTNIPGPQLNIALANPGFFNELHVRRAVIPAANGNFSALGLAKFYNYLVQAAYGISPAQQPHSQPLFRPETVDYMSSGNALGNRSARGEFGLGFKRYKFNPPKESTSPTSPTAAATAAPYTAFGHAGMGGSFAFCDPSRKLAIAVTVNQLSLVSPIATKELVNTITESLGYGMLSNFAGDPTSGPADSSMTFEF
eukprot:jgi/Hompol1/5108/HPOL_004167-RA